MITISGSEYCILSLMNHVSTYHIEGDRGGAFRADLRSRLQIPPKALDAAIESLISKKLFHPRDDGTIFFSRNEVKKTLQNVLGSPDNGILREILILLGEAYVNPSEMILVEGINRLLHIADDQGFSLYLALRDLQYIAVQTPTTTPAHYGVYLSPKMASLIKKGATPVMTSSNSIDATSTSSSPIGTSRRVFIVHGHDGGLKNAVARYIEKLGLEAIILHEQPNRGRTVIEKFEQESDIGFTIVLATRDDLAATVKTIRAFKADPDATEQVLEERARQNVIFELGFFVGKHGRGKIALLSDSVNLPSDLNGIVYIAREQWQNELLRELTGAGFVFTPSQMTAALAVQG